MLTISIDADKSIIHKLAVYIMDRSEAVAALKNKGIEIDPITPLTIDEVIDIIKSFLTLNNIEGIVKYDGKKINVIITSAAIDNYREGDLLTCPHCGKVSRYEEEMMVHIKAHYIGF